MATDVWFSGRENDRLRVDEEPDEVARRLEKKAAERDLGALIKLTRVPAGSESSFEPHDVWVSPARVAFVAVAQDS